MARKPKFIDFDQETQALLTSLYRQLGQPVPLSCSYTHQPRPVLVAIRGDRATLKFHNGVTMLNVPLKDLVDDRSYWS